MHNARMRPPKGGQTLAGNFRRQEVKQQQTRQRTLDRLQRKRGHELGTGRQSQSVVRRRQLMEDLRKELDARRKERLFREVYGHLLPLSIVNGTRDALADVLMWLVDRLGADTIRSLTYALPFLAAFVIGGSIGWLLTLIVPATARGLSSLLVLGFRIAVTAVVILCTFFVMLVIVCFLGTSAYSVFRYLKFFRQRQRLLETQTECAVCFDELSDDDGAAVTRLVCGHAFHADCVQVWIAERGACPLCRQTL